MQYRPLDSFSLFDLEMARLVLRGGSVLDWVKLNLTNDAIQELIRSHRLDLDDQRIDVRVHEVFALDTSGRKETIGADPRAEGQVHVEDHIVVARS